MSSIMTKIAEETNGKSFRTFKYSFDSTDMPSFDYDDHSDITWERIGETVTHKKAIDLSNHAKQITGERPCFTYFLDGSRRAFKVDDISYRNQVYPVIAGQVGIGCCKRLNKEMTPFDYERRLVIALPKVANQDDWNKKLFFKNLLKKVNADDRLIKEQLEFTDIIPYSCKKDEVEKMGIAVIQDLMVEQEKMMVAKLASKNLLSYDNYLLKDGSLEYRIIDMKSEREIRSFKNNYRWVVGASKSFNPENCKDHSGKNNSNLIADLKLYHRTPVSMYSSPRIGMNYIKAKVIGNTQNIYNPLLNNEKVYFANATEVSQALGLSNMKHPVLCGYLEMYNGADEEDRIKLQVNMDSRFLIGPEGAHLNISGISGLAAKTSYAMFLLKSIQDKCLKAQNNNDTENDDDVAFVLFNVKGKDLLALDEPNEFDNEKDKQETFALYDELGMSKEPFKNVTYYYPYSDRNSWNTYMDKDSLEDQQNLRKALFYKYEYEYDKDNLDLMFASLDDPTQSMDSILNYIISNQGDFGNLSDWEDFLDEVQKKCKAGG